MTPAENKTVEALAERVDAVLRNHHDSGCFVYLPSGACDCGVPPNTEARAALRDLVAQADRAAELEAALRDALDRNSAAQQAIDTWLWGQRRLLHSALAGDGGGA